MKYRVNAIIGAVSVFLILGIGLVISYSISKFEFFYSAWQYHGDGVISDQGFFSYYPRYNISFRPKDNSPIWSGEFNIGNPPPVPLTFCFKVKTDLADAKVKTLSPNIVASVRIVGKSGDVLSVFSDSLDKWTLCSSVDERYYWHNSLTDLELWKYNAPKLLVQIKSVNNCPVPIALEPCLFGGGHEFP